jgi:hypothetical protein
MDTTELIKFFQEHDFTDDQGYNLLTSDIYEAVTEEQIAEPGAQRLGQYFLYKIEQVLFPVIRGLKAPPATSGTPPASKS